MQIWRAVEFQTEVVLTSNGKMVFMYLGVGVKVAFPLKQGFSTSLRGGITWIESIVSPVVYCP